MLKPRLLRLALLGLLVLPAALAMAQEPATLKSLVDGTVAPNRLKPADLTDEYWPVQISLSGVGGGMFDMMGLMPLMMMGAIGGGDKAEPQLAALKAAQVSWTKGQTVQLGNTPFLVTYKLDFDPLTMGGAQTPMLHLVLVKPEAITSLGSMPDYTKEQFISALNSRAESAASDAPGEAIPIPPPADLGEAKSRSVSNVKQAALGMMMYMADYDEQIPYVQSTKSAIGVVRPYLKSDSVWTTFNPNGNRVLMAMNLAGVSFDEVESPSETPFLYEERAWPDGSRIVAYFDGHVKTVSSAEWQALAPLLKKRYPRRGRPLPANYMTDPTPDTAPMAVPAIRVK
jgi:prepilin-type processing-associated H-X9-DG protein